ncbi:MAG TPA: response regulator transcription factor [Candidatus Binatia bacterium]|nr:response regulator transcription factor [Candidatus Binatia bacterium]
MTSHSESTRILVVDDEPEIREMLELNLKLRGYEVRAAPDGVEGLAIVREWRPDLIILDVVMPKLDGFTLLPMIRRITEAPIILLTAKSGLSDKVKGLEGGADDYLAKPFEVAELIARVEKALRRPSLKRRTTLLFADLSVDLQTYAVVRGSVRIDLTAREFSVLTTLMRSPGQVFSREHLLAAVWGTDSDAELGIVDRTISNLRAKVDHGFETKLIQTIRGIGYSVRD